MKLLNISMHNIGPYINQTIDLTTLKKKNVILLCGDNGAGKTTLLRAIKLGLFGSVIFGLKQDTQSVSYISEVQDLIRNNTTDASIQIEFLVIEDYLEYKYTIRRKWDITGKFKEVLDVYLNGKKLHDEDLENAIEYINHYFTPDIIDSIMFDGEKVINIIDDNELSSYIKDAVQHLFGLDYHLNLIDDIQKYLDVDIKKENMSIEQIELSETEQKVKVSKAKLKTYKSKYEQLVELNKQNLFKISKLTNEYAHLGGLLPDEAKEFKKIVNELENYKSKSKDQIKYFLEHNLIFLMNRDLIEKVLHQIDLEKPSFYKNSLEEMKESNVFDQTQIELINQLINSLSTRIDDAVNVDLNPKVQQLFIDYKSQLNDAETNYNSLMNKANISVEKLKMYKQKLAITDTNEMNDLFNEIVALSTESSNIDQEIEQYKTLEENELREYNSFKQKVEVLKKKVFEQTKSNDSYVIAKKYMDICQQYYDSEIEEITQRLCKESLELLTKTYRKSNYITDIKINSDFEIRIFDENGEKSITQLSAGEKQLFAASLIVTVVKMSNRNIMMIFDTPAGRLDQPHMVNFYENIVKDAASQVVIMPTSKEINQDVLDCLSPQLMRCSTISYQNPNKGSVVINNKIFKEDWISDSKN